MTKFKVGDRVRDKRTLTKGTVTRRLDIPWVKVLYDTRAVPKITPIEDLEHVPEEKFRVGDRVRSKAHPRLAGEVIRLHGDLVYFRWDNDTALAFPFDELEYAHATEEDWKEVAQDLTEDEDERISAWHEVVRHPFFKNAYSDGDRLLPAMLKKLDNLMAEPEEKKAELRCTHKSCRLCRDAKGLPLPGEEVAQPRPNDREPLRDGWSLLSAHDALVQDMTNLLAEWGSTFDKKQRAYGPKAIANAPLGAAEGLLNRIHDKYSRLVQLMQNPDVDDLGEATADTVKDMGIYCAMLVLVNEGKWPGV